MHDSTAVQSALPFPTAVWPILGPNLRKLSIEVTLRKLPPIVKASLRLDNLEELEISLSAERSPRTDTAYKALVADNLVPFINREMGLPYFSRNRQTISFLGSLSASLTALSLIGCYLEHEAVVTLTSSFAHSREGGGLETLRFSVHGFSPQLVDLLANNLPRLEKLDVTFDMFVSINAT